MANDAYIDDSYLQAQSAQEEQEYALWLYEQEQLIDQANKELNMMNKRSSVTLNDGILIGESKCL